MKKLLVVIPFLLLGCAKGKRDETYTFVCRSACKVDPFTIVYKDTTFVNITQGEANIYARDRTAQTGCYTTCQRQ